MAIGQFGNKSAAKPVGNGAARKSKWAGVKSSQPKDPVLHAGTYRLEILDPEPGRTGQWFKPHFRIVAQADGQVIHADGDEVLVLLNTTTDAGRESIKNFLVAGSGYEDDEQYAAADPDDSDLVAYVGGLRGRFVDVRVKRGKDFVNKNGEQDYYRECDWAPASAEEQG
jgi:hypothetical protein